MTIEAQDLHRILRQIIEPARRHKCALCSDIFECHLCMIEEDHNIHINSGPKDHSGGSKYICESCIHKNELHIVIIHIQIEASGRIYRGRELLSLGKQKLFYDHITSRLLGKGTIRRS